MTEWESDTCIIQIKRTSKDYVPDYHVYRAIDALEDYVGDYEELGFICNVEMAAHDEPDGFGAASKKWDKFEEDVEGQNERNSHKKRWIASDAWFMELTEEELAEFLLEYANKGEEYEEEDEEDDEIFATIRSFASGVWSWLWDDGELSDEDYEEGCELYCDVNYGEDDD